MAKANGAVTRMLAVLTLLYALSLLDRHILSLLIVPVRRDLAVSDFGASLLQGLSFALFYCLMGLPFGYLADRRSRRGLIFFGIVTWSIAAMACGLARDFGTMFLARACVGVGEAALLPAAFSIISDSLPRARLAFAMSIFATGSTIGTGISLAGGGLLIGALPTDGVTLPLLGHLAPWRMTMLLTGLPGALLCWLIFLIPEPPRADRLGVARPSFGALLTFLRAHLRFFGGHFVGFGLLAMCGTGFLVWAPTYMVRRFHWELGPIGLAIAFAIGIAGSIGPVLIGRLVDARFARGQRDAHLKTYVVTGWIQAGLVLCAVSTGSPILFVIFATLILALNSFNGVAAAAVHLVTPNDFRGQISALYLLVMSMIGSGFGPSVVAAFTDYVFHSDAMLGWSLVATYALGMPLATLLLLGAAKPMRAAIGAAGAG